MWFSIILVRPSPAALNNKTIVSTTAPSAYKNVTTMGIEQISNLFTDPDTYPTSSRVPLRGAAFNAITRPYPAHDIKEALTHVILNEPQDKVAVIIRTRPGVNKLHPIAAPFFLTRRSDILLPVPIYLLLARARLDNGLWPYVALGIAESRGDVPVASGSRMSRINEPE